MVYDEDRARRYDRTHPQEMAEAPTTVATLVELAALARARDGRPGRALELGVGTGRLAVPLAEAGIEVWGIDNSAPMLDRLRAKPGGDLVHLVEGDFARVADLVDGEFSLVYVAYSTLFELGSQAAQVSCIAGAAGHLSPGGVLAVEALAPDHTLVEQSLAATHVGTDSVGLQVTRHDPVHQVVEGCDIHIDAEGTHLSPWTIRYVSMAELDLMARLGGLVLRSRWGGWQGQPFTAASPRHVSVYEPPPAGS